ncbi:MAG: TonB-dependent receptor plug domain-containing protein, partial [Sphingobacterium sp.]
MISKFTSNQKVSLLAVALLVASSQSTFAVDRPIVFMNTAKVVEQNPIAGKVTAEDGPLAGVTVSVKGTSVSTSTDANGAFSIKAKAGDILVVSSVGYKSKEVTVAGNTISIQLESDNSALEEVVVVGFAKQKKVNLTGAVQAITSKDLQDRPVTNVSSAIQGKFSGVTITQNSGQPGKDNGTIRIRGLGTINNANPLVIVDGIESSMNNINPNDIESVSVLKDGPSAAIYGSKAANGVILITTKKGGSGKPQLNYTGYAGIQDPTRLPEYMNAYDHAVILNEALKNEGKDTRFSAQDLELFKNGSDPDGHPNTDWLGLLYKGSGFQQSHN